MWGGGNHMNRTNVLFNFLLNPYPLHTPDVQMVQVDSERRRKIKSSFQQKRLDQRLTDI